MTDLFESWSLLIEDNYYHLNELRTKLLNNPPELSNLSGTSKHWRQFVNLDKNRLVQ